MNRLAFAAAAALLGTGCVSSSSTPPPPPRYGSVNVYWDFVRNAPGSQGGVIVYDDTDTGSPDGACDDSSVEIVEVTSPVGTTTVSCVYAGVEGVGIDGIPAGIQTFRFRGWRGDYLVYETTVNLDVHADMTMDYTDIDLGGVSATLEMFGDLYNTGTAQYYANCGAATPVSSNYPPNVEYFVNDVWGNPVEHAVVSCGAALPSFVFSDQLDLDNYDVRMQGRRVEDGALVFDSCWLPLDHFAADTGANAFQAVLLTNPIPTCP